MLDQFFDYMSEHCSTTIIDVRKALLKEKNNHQLYWKMDTHWNYYGAYIGYSCLMKEINVSAIIPISDYNVIKTKRVCDISKNMLGLGSWVKEVSERLEYKNTNYTLDNPEDGLYISKVNDNSLPTMYFIRDSFGGLIQKYLAPSFKEIYTTINNDAVNVPDYVKEKTYDYIVIEVTERSLTAIHSCIINELGIGD